MLSKDEVPLNLFNKPLFLRSDLWNLGASTLPTCPGFGPAAGDSLGSWIYCVLKGRYLQHIWDAGIIILRRNSEQASLKRSTFGDED